MTDRTHSAPYQNLRRASELLDTAAVLAAETADADLQLCRALSQAVALLAEISRVLVEESMQEMH